MTSLAVIGELERGEFPGKPHALNILVMWNFQHLAKANKFDHVRRVNGILGLMVPALVTPLELLAENPGDHKE